MGNIPRLPGFVTQPLLGSLLDDQPLKEVFPCWGMYQPAATCGCASRRPSPTVAVFKKGSKDRPAYPEAPWSSWSSPLELLDPGTDNFSPCGDHGSDGAQRHDLHQPVILTSKGEPLLETADKTMDRLGSTASRILQCRLPWRHITRAVPFTGRKPRAHPSRPTVRHYGC